MAPPEASTIELPSAQALQSDEQMKLLDTIDSLRAIGLNESTFLPQLIVCGDQSTGKSSVLEAISGVPFPRKSGVCTRFATEVILRRDLRPHMSVSIIPSEDLPKPDQERLKSFGRELASKKDFVELFEEAKTAMGIPDQGKSFSKNILRVEFRGPQQPQLTLVDLPGLIHATVGKQTEDDILLVNQLVGKYLENPRSIILPVVSGTNDFSTQAITQMVRKFDPQGKRALGIITKPDLIRSGEIETWLKVARNDEVNFHLGWHVVKNPELGQNDITQETRDEQEIEFFNNSNFSILPAESRGIDTLRTRLSKVLFRQIQETLPSVMKDVENKIHVIKAERDKLGPSRSTLSEQRNYLIQISESFKAICTYAIGGHYDHGFFEEDPDQSKCLYANLYTKHVEFAKTLQDVGASWQINDDYSNGEYRLNEINLNGTYRTRKQAIKEAYKLLKDKRGTELPGLPNPYVVGRLFRDHSRPWEGIAQKHIEEVWDYTKRFIEEVLHYLTDEDVCDKLLRFWLDPIMDDTLEVAKGKLNELLEIHRDHPMTFNTDFMKNRKLLQEERSEEKTPDDMDMVAAEEAFDNMNAYYQVAIKLFIDNVPNLAIRAPIVKKIPTMLSPTAVSTRMNDDLVAKIAGESVDTANKRTKYLNELEKLEKGALIFKEYALRLPSTLRPAAKSDNVTTSQSSAQNGTGKGKTSDSSSTFRNHSASTATNERPLPSSSPSAGINFKTSSTSSSSSKGPFIFSKPSGTGLGGTPSSGFGAPSVVGFGSSTGGVFGSGGSTSGPGFGGTPGGLFGSPLGASSGTAKGTGSGFTQGATFGSTSKSAATDKSADEDQL